MKFGIATVSISGNLEEKIEAIAASGFDGIEISDCGLAEAGDNRTGENMNATYVVAGSGETLTVSAASRAEAGRSIVLTCDMSQPPDSRISISYENW